MTDSDFKKIFETTKVIAAVGLSNTRGRAGSHVCHYLQAHGYRVIPVNPNEEEVNGEKSYDALADVPDAIDLVLVFRNPRAVPALVEEALKTDAKIIWMQDGAGNNSAANTVREAGKIVVVDDCMLRQHVRLIGA